MFNLRNEEVLENEHFLLVLNQAVLCCELRPELFELEKKGFHLFCPTDEFFFPESILGTVSYPVVATALIHTRPVRFATDISLIAL